MSDRITTREVYEKIHELDKKNETYQAHIVSELKATNNHLKQLNSKVAKNVKEIATNKKDVGQIMISHGNLYTKVDDFEKKERKREEFNKKIWWFWIERAMWFAIALGGLILTKLDILNI